MRRRPRLLAALGAGALVALSSTFVVVAVAVAAPEPAGPTVVDDTPVPPDFLWPWVMWCERDVGLPPGSSMASFGVDDDGTVAIEYGFVDEEGSIEAIDEPLTERIGACIGSRRIAMDGRVSRRADDSIRLAVYDWAVRQQQPCLAAHGIKLSVPPLEEFLGQDSMPWYLLDQYIWTRSGEPLDIEFDALLEARLACPPFPPYLRDEGLVF